MENKSKKMLVLLGVIVVIVLIIVVAALQGKKNAGNPAATNNQTNEPATTPGGETPGTGPGATTTAPVVNDVLKDAVIAAPGASAVTKDNKVVNLQGEQTNNAVDQTSPLAPSESGPVALADLADGVIKLEVSAAGYTPNKFTVKAGSPVSVSLTATDYAHNFGFEDPALAAVAIGVYRGETRVVSFNAPTKPGDYVFFCNVGGNGHRARGEVGTMTVK